MWYLVNTVLGEYLAKFKTTGTYLFSKAANDYVKVGATFSTYEFAGNQISFKVDRTFSREYGLTIVQVTSEMEKIFELYEIYSISNNKYC